MQQTRRAGVVGVDDMQDVVEGLVEEPLPQAMPSVRGQDIQRPPGDKAVEGLDSLLRGQIGLQGLDRCAEALERLPGLRQRRVRRHHQIEPIGRQQLCQLISDPCRRSSDESQGPRSIR